jgi:uncharacterized membrane protein
MLSVMATRTRPPAEAATRPGISNRLVTVDVFRGLALAFMAVAHCAYLMGVNLVAERFDSDVPFRITSWTEFVLALLGNPCAIMLWSSAGMAIALFERGRRAVGVPERTILARLLARPLVLLAVAVFVIPPLWAVKGHAAAYTFDILSCLAVSMIFMAFLRNVPTGALLAGTLALLAAMPAIRQALPLDPAQPHAFWSAVWLHFSLKTQPQIWYPILPWLPVMVLGYVLGRWARPETLERAEPWRNAALATFALAVVFRFGGAYFNLVPELPLPAWPRLVILCRQPPSLTYLAWNCALAMLMYSGIAALASRAAHGGAGARVPGALLAPLNAIGREPLVFFMTHFAVFQVLTRQAKRFPGGEPVWRMLVIASIGIVVLFVTCRAFGRLRERYPRSILRYL